MTGGTGDYRINYTTDTAATWSKWATVTQATGTTAAAAAGTWYAWNDKATCSTHYVTVTNDAWTGWITSAKGIEVQQRRLLRRSLLADDTPQPVEVSREEMLAQAQRREEYEAREQRRAEALRAAQAKLDRERADADKRAEALLLDNLDAAQRAEYTLGKSFMVRGSAGNLYRVRHGTHGNLDVIDAKTGAVTRRLCVYAVGVPACDSMLAQKLLLEACEEMLTSKANPSTPLTAERVAVPDRMKEYAA